MRHHLTQEIQQRFGDAKAIPEESLAIQASYSLTDLGTRKREVDALLALNKKHPLQKARIITYDEEETIQEGGQTIEVIPIWKWLADFF